MEEELSAGTVASQHKTLAFAPNLAFRTAGHAATAILALAAIALLGATLRRYWVYALVAPPSFDGGMNLNVAASLARGQGYGFVYDIFYPFPAQTDGPFVLPAALAFSLGGIGMFTSQVVNLVYVGLFFAAASWLFRLMGAPLWLAVGAAVLVGWTPGFPEYAMNGFGEVIVLFWFFCGLVCAERSLGSDRAFGGLVGSGALFATAYLTKVVALICVAPAIAVFALAPLVEAARWRRILALALGFAGVVAAWELFRLIEIGGFLAYSKWWELQLGQVLSQSGAKGQGADLAGHLKKGAAHFEILRGFVGLPAPLLMLYLAGPYPLAVWLAAKSSAAPGQRLLVAALAAASAAYFAWWLFITPTEMAWLRRILDGLVIHQSLVVGLAVVAGRGVGVKATRRGALVAMALALPAIWGAAMTAARGQTLLHPPNLPQQRSAETLKLAELMRGLPPNAVVFGLGWWKAPVPALLSGRTIMNLEHWDSSALNALPEKYFVMDGEAQSLAKAEIAEAFASLRLTQIFVSPSGSLYRVEHADPYAPFRDKDFQLASLASGVNFRVANYSVTRGFFSVSSPEPRWSRSESAIVLKRKDQTALQLELWTPPKLAVHHGSDAPILTIKAEGCLDAKISAPSTQITKVSLPLACPPSAEEIPMLVQFGFDDHVRYPPQIDMDSRMLSFILSSVQLTATPRGAEQ